MRNLLALIGLAVVGFAGLGWYFQWYSFASTTGLDGKTQYQLSVDQKKIATDAKHLGDRVSTAVQPPATANPPVPPAPALPPAPDVKYGPDGTRITMPAFEVRVPGR